MNRSFCTVVSHSYLPQALALGESLRTAGNPEPLHVLVTDLQPGEDSASGDAVRLLSLDRLQGSFPPLMRYYFDAFELCNALKPFVISHLLEAGGCDQVVYLDADIWVTGAFTPVWDELDRTPVLFTPHHLTPPPADLQHVKEHEVADLGFLNGGFSAWRAGAESRQVLAWLAERLPVAGFCDRARSMFVDQKLLPLTLSYFPAAVRILRDPGLNVAYWNAHERPVTFREHWWVGESRVVFFHLSGYALSRPTFACAYLPDAVNGQLLRRAPWLAEVLARYGELLSRHRPRDPARPYGFARYKGVRLSRPLRYLLFETGGLDPTSPRVWLIRLIENLRLWKRAWVARWKKPRSAP